MAQVTFTIPDSKIQYFIDYYGLGYDEAVASGEVDGGAVTKVQYAKSKALELLASQVKKYNKQLQVESLTAVDITAE